jgi:hypothetical protein
MRKCNKNRGLVMNVKSVVWGAVLVSAVCCASALTLGKARGAAWIGQSLDITIPVQMDPGQTDSALCAEADIYYADTRQETARVQVNASASTQPDVFNVRITAAQFIDEPVVTIYLRAGCAQKTARKYVLLADYPPEGAPSSTRAADPVAPGSPLVPIPSAAPTAGSDAGTSPAQSKAESRVPKQAANVPSKPAVERAPKPTATKPAAASPTTLKKSAEGTGKPRLKLDPLEGLAERIKSLEAATVAAAPEAAASDAKRIDQLQGDIRALLDQAAKNEASLRLMRERMEKAEADRVPMEVVYVLIALVITGIAGLAYLWARRPQPQTMFIPSPLAAANPPLTQPAALVTQPPLVAATNSRPPVKPAGHDSGLDVDLVDLDEDAFSALMNTPRKKPPTGG